MTNVAAVGPITDLINATRYDAKLRNQQVERAEKGLEELLSDQQQLLLALVSIYHVLQEVVPAPHQVRRACYTANKALEAVGVDPDLGNLPW